MTIKSMNQLKPILDKELILTFEDFNAAFKALDSFRPVQCYILSGTCLKLRISYIILIFSIIVCMSHVQLSQVNL